MFQKAKVVIEKLYTGKCTVTEYQEYTRENKSTGYREAVALENQPCRLSFSNIAAANSTDTAAQLAQVVKVFMAPEIKVKPGSKLTITQNNVTTEYKSSGEPAIYETHQEIVLELFKGWT